MGKLVKVLSAAGAVALLSACAEWDATLDAFRNIDDPLADNYEAAKAAAPEGSDFNRHLHGEYLKLATSERSEYDWRDSAAFSDKALAAAEGQEVNPDALYDRRIPKIKVAELAEARNRLTTALESGARSAAPESAAKAQTSFDCWLQEQEENHQSEDIDACRRAFYAAIDATEGMIAAKPSSDYLVYFGFNSTKLSPEATATIVSAAGDLKTGRAKKLILSGHADKAGPGIYNLSLSERRVSAVRQLLLSTGVKAEQISISAFGDTQPRVATTENAREPENRRVEINLVK